MSLRSAATPPSHTGAGTPHDEQQVQATLVSLLYGKSAQIRFTNFFAIALAAMVFWPHVPRTPLLVWVGLSCLQTTLHMALDRHHQRHPPPARDAGRWGWIFTGFSVLAGSLWGAPGVLFFMPDNLFVTGFICILIGSISAGSVAPLAPFKPAYYVTALTIVLPFAILALVHGGTLFTALGLLALLLLWVNFTSCHQVHQSLRESVLLRFENLSLMRQLQVETRRAQDASRAKTQFLAAASHDLGQPAHALNLFVAALEALGRRPALQPRDVGAVAQRMRTTLAGMGQLLDMLLEVSRLDAGVVASDPRPAPLEPLLAALRDEFAAQADAKGLTLQVESTPLWAVAEPQLLASVLRNLVSNAVRYTDSGHIRVSCRRDGDAVRMDVTDTGIGIAQDQLGRIFQEFYQVGSVPREREKGFGLGLSIVQRYADLLHARLQVQSSPGEGSTFSVLLPHAQAPQAAGAPSPSSPSSSAAGAMAAGLKVLVIDDDPVVLEATCELLAAWGHVALAAGNQHEAVALACQTPPDLVLADYRLAGGATGVEAIAAVRAALARALPAFLVTGEASAEHLEAARAHGLAVLRKPLEPQLLANLLTSPPGSGPH